MEGDIYQLLQLRKQKDELNILISCNVKTQNFGLSLSENEANQLVISRNNSLKKHKRVEFGKGILDQLIFVFCDSQYINQDNYVETMVRLQDIFYEYKNEVNDKLTDDELMTFMREQFETVCFGDVKYLEETCLANFAEAIRKGYSGYEKTGGQGEYQKFDEAARWDKDLYMDIAKDLFW